MNKYKFFSKIILFFLSLVLLFLTVIILVFVLDNGGGSKVMADENDNVFGHAWSENIGWISFNCATHENKCYNDLSVSCVVDQDCADAGAGGACAAECGDSDYGVNVDEATGDITGYAWSPQVGWISFNRSDAGNPPSQPYKNGTIIAHYNSGNDEIEGWGKALSMGDDGWIKLRKFSSDAGASYGLSVNASGQWTGWAWGGNSGNTGIGWLSFNCADSGAGGCVNSNYKVYSSSPPTVSNLTMAYPRVTKENSYCYDPSLSPANYDIGQVILRWTFSDNEDGATQTAYELEIHDSPSYNPSSRVIDTGKRTSGALQYFIGADADCAALAAGDCDTLLSANTTYYWRVNVWDSSDDESGWVNGPSFTTEPHDYPKISDIAASPENPRALEDTYFTQTTEAYGGSSINSYSWVFTNATPNASTTPNPGPVQFQSAENQTATLIVTDTSGLSCTQTKNLDTTISLPIWKEVRPI